MNKDSLKRLIDVANGNKKADLVLKNGSIVDVCSGKIFKADLAIAEGYIAGFGEYDGETEVDIEGKYIAPGLMDAHIHHTVLLKNSAEWWYLTVLPLS